MRFPDPVIVPPCSNSRGILPESTFLSGAPLEARRSRPPVVRADPLDEEGAGPFDQRHVLHWVVSACLVLGSLVGCDLEEAGRLDPTRSSSGSQQPLLQGVVLDGSTDLALTRVLYSAWDPLGGGRWSLSWIDLPPAKPVSGEWRIRGELDGADVLVVVGFGTLGRWIVATSAETWMERSGDVRLHLDSLSSTDDSWQPWIPELPQRIRDDRPGLERVFSFAPGEIRKRGDTLFVAVRNTGVNPVAVYSDFSGVRQIGAYELLVPPGARDTLRWLVTDAPSDDRWIDLGWGDWGLHEKRSFRAP
jgi:hypothetical protein